MDIQRSLFWEQGLLLQPQHFQLQDLSFRSLLAPFLQYLEPDFWGISKTEIQEAALGNGIFNLVKGTFLFQDGTYAVLPDNAMIESRRFDEAWIEGGKPLPVYVGLKKWNNTGENVTVLETAESFPAATTRCVTLRDAEEVADLHACGPKGNVKRLHYLLRIFWETEREQAGDYVLLPVAQLERMGEKIVLSQHFIPPCLTITSSEPLMKLVKETRDQITARCHQLEAYKMQRGIQTAEFGTRDMVYLLALRSLNRYAPLLYHITETQQIHPWYVYGTIRQLIGELSSFDERVNVLGEAEDGTSALPGYNHWKLWECFSAAQSLIIQLLDKITAGPDYVIRMVYDGTYYTAELKPEMFEGRNRFYLVFNTEEDPKSLIHYVTTIAKLGSRERLPILIAKAISGIKVEHLSVAPPQLPRRAHATYFAIDHHSDQWALVTKGNNIALYWDNAPEDLEVELMVVGK